MPIAVECTGQLAVAPSHRSRPWGKARLEHAQTRYVIYCLLAAVLSIAAMVLVGLKSRLDFVVSDGRYYYVYLPSLVIDGDLDFSNQMREHWGDDGRPELEADRTERGLVRNKYPIGLALTLTPSFLLGHGAAVCLYAVTRAHWCAPDGYSAPYQVSNLLFLLALGASAMMRIDRLLTTRFRIKAVPTFLAIVTFWLGTHFLYYYAREPFMPHLAGMFWVTLSVTLVADLVSDLGRGRLSAWRLCLFTFATAMALVCRPSNAFLLPFCIYLFYYVARAGMAGRFLRLTPAVLLGMAPLYAQMAVWYGLYGRFVTYSYAGESFHWLQPAAWQTLFSSRHGLFFWSPLLLASATGVGWRLWLDRSRPDPLVACFLASFLLLWYCNSCWWNWWFGDAFGGRAFLELSSFFILGLASAFEFVSRRRRRIQVAFGGFVGTCVAYNFVLMACYILHRIPRGDFLL